MASPPGLPVADSLLRRSIEPASGEDPATSELDVPRLLESSYPRGGMGRWLLLLPPLGLVGLGTAVLLMLLSPGRSLWAPLMALAALATSAGSMIALARLAGQVRAERREVAQIDELITLRHFPSAAAKIEALLGRPMRVEQNRLLGLIQLARVLMRYDRFEDAIEVANAIVDDPRADPGTRFAVGCGRAMAMLRAGRLYDAGEALSQLRREVSRLDDAVRRLAEQADVSAGAPDLAGTDHDPTSAHDDRGENIERSPAGFDSVALTLVELYRDIQTRHSDEALATVQEKRTALRDGLGIRFADALALASLAAMRLDRRPEAAQLWSDATCLLPETELRRRYPELSEVAVAYPSTPRPAPPSAVFGMAAAPGGGA